MSATLLDTREPALPDAPIAFFSYSREDSEFALRLANDLRAAGSAVWIDQLDIGPGERWDRVVQSALETCPSVLVILSPASVNSNNVLDEVSFALDQNKTLIPVLYRECDIPFRLRRFQHVDFRGDYDHMLQELRKCLHIGQQPALEHATPPAPVQTSVPSSRSAQADVPGVTPPPVAPTRPYEPERPTSSASTPSSVIPAWAKYGIPAAIIVVAVIVYLLAGSNPKKRDENNNKRKVDTPIAEPAAGQETINRAALGTVELTGTALSHAPTSPPCTLPSLSQSQYSTTDPGAWFFFAFRRGESTDQWSVDWVEPNDYLHKTNAVQHVEAAGHYCFEMKIAGTPAQNAPGRWTVRLNRNGTEVAQRSFTISR
jgi:hypothetical protein